MWSSTTFAPAPRSSGFRRGLELCAVAVLVVGTSSCVGRLDAPPPRTASQFTQGRTLADLDALTRLRAAADVSPEQLEPQWRAGMAHLRASLQGHVDQREHAERYLERAWLLDPEAKRVPAARVLARLLNMRSSVLDLSKLDLQLRLYAALVEQTSATKAEAFAFTCFAAAATALQRYAQGHTLAALRELEALERAMRARTRQHPDDIDAHAMAGNFELTFAGVIPVGVEQRLTRGIDYLEVQQDHWDQLSPRARNTGVAPNVRSVFALFLAEGLLAHGDVEAAAGRYAQILEFEDQADTGPRRQIVSLAQHRLANLETYAGARELLPPWPAGVTGCVACHSREATLPTDDLYLVPGVVLR
ncbi:hypothetical protein DB30_02344 [Enhygromyxa salina]|uniref:Uncharacterized protein n=1 Tax=Enhygromyxa salina TaxID=215803 RepID=A0A0C2D3X0_9BACT|nr:hypothetical protein [Enhygromyxa salina]KIG17916.1 hypothetical protein DB30_02344 [Enhygromyxa salina]